ncbi:hypothetical protein HA402_006783 [Bradysia odoriphaga]|nr:hypothetical protein HA402_006783 [Bradysia odoriphaga]
MPTTPKLRLRWRHCVQRSRKPDADNELLITTLYRFMDEDRKSTALKSLQGIIWRSGYLNGDFQGHLYPEVAEQLAAWQQQGLKLYVYSSGSVEAQKLLFGYSDAGDLQPLFSGYFDTHIGPSVKARHTTISPKAIGLEPTEATVPVRYPSGAGRGAAGGLAHLPTESVTLPIRKASTGRLTVLITSN